MVWFAGPAPNFPGLQAQLAANPLHDKLEVVKQGRVVFLENPKEGGQNLVRGALAPSTVLSLPYALDRLVPLLVAAVDGDPGTAVPTTTRR